MGFQGSKEVAYTATIAPVKALLAAEGGITEGKIYHTGVITEFARCSTIAEEGLDSAMIGRESTDAFAKRDQTGGYDPKAKTVTRKENASGLNLVGPYDDSNPWEPSIGNFLGKVAAGLANTASKSFFSKAQSFSTEGKMDVLIVSTRNANGPALDRMASAYFIRELGLHAENSEDKAILQALMADFREARSTIGTKANSPSSHTMKIGLPHCEYSFSRKPMWTNEGKVRRVKELLTVSGEKVYMAPAYLNFQLFTVPIDIDTIKDKIVEDIILWQKLAVTYVINQSLSILEKTPKEMKKEEWADLSRYAASSDIPSVYSALGLTEADDRAAKVKVVSDAEDLMIRLSMSSERGERVEALRNFNRQQRED